MVLTGRLGINEKRYTANFEWFTGGADWSEKAREDRGREGLLSMDRKVTM